MNKTKRTIHEAIFVAYTCQLHGLTQNGPVQLVTKEKTELYMQRCTSLRISPSPSVQRLR